MTFPEDVVSLDACPRLGSTVDEDTRFAYPSEGNRCYALDEPERIAFPYQQGYCLGKNHQDCPLFQGTTHKMPPEARWQGRETPLSVPGLHWGWLLTLFVILALLGGGAWLFTHPAAPAVTVSPFPALALQPTDTATPAPSPTATLLPQPAGIRTTPSPTLPPTETFTPAPPTPGPGLETPFGPQRAFLVHKVRVGESLTAIAEQYATSVDVLRATNVFVPGATLWAGQTLVVMPGVVEVPADAQPLLPVYVERDTTIAALAGQYAVDASALRKLNAFGAGDIIPGGRWVLVPQGG